MKTNSIKYEIGVHYTLVLGAILVTFSGVLYYLISFTLYNELNNNLKVTAQDISQSMRATLDQSGKVQESLKQSIDAALKPPEEKPPAAKNRNAKPKPLSIRITAENPPEIPYVNIMTLEGFSIYGSTNLNPKLRSKFLSFPNLGPDGTRTFRNITFRQQKIRIINYPFHYKEGRNYIIQVGMSVQPIVQVLQNWLHSLIISIPLILLLTSLMGHYLADRILESVRTITGTARKITLQDLSSRVTSKHQYIEMQDLVDAFNEMISRLETSFRHIEDFSSHVSHELKTPLTIIKGEAELTLRKERTPEEYRRAIQVSVEESERMIKTIEDLLMLSKIDYEPKAFQFESFNFCDFFKEISEQTRLLADAKRIQIHSAIPDRRIIINADRLHLRRLFFNLIDNAIKFTPPTGQIHLSVKNQHRWIVASIADTGPGISEEDLSRIFDRFYHGKAEESGMGLGLNIVQAIARVHRADIQVDTKPQEGTTFRVILPKG